MKKFAFVFAALAACFAISCTKEVADDAPQGGMQTVTVTASVEQMTKTAYDADGKFAWHKGDQISILGTDKIFYTFTATEAGETTTFTGLLPEGVELRKEAYYPADPGHHRDGDNWFFNVAEYKDLTATGSADLPMGAYLEPGNYVFRHITGAALFTFTDIPEGIEAVEIAFSHGVQLSGEFQSWTGSDDAGKFWVYGAHNAAEGTTQGSYVRKVSVVENTAKVYLPYPTDGKIWSGLHVSVTGFNAAGEEVVLLEDLATAQNIDEMPRATVTPVEPISLAAEDEGIDWNAEGIQTATLTETFINEYPGKLNLTELKAFADAENLYVRLKVADPTEASSALLRYYFAAPEGANTVWYWEKDTFGDFIKSSKFKNLDITYGSDSVAVTTEVIEGETYWQLIFPRAAHALTTSAGSVKIGFLTYTASEAETGFMPQCWTNMMEVTLP